MIPVVDELTDTREQVPGRSWLRLAMLVAVGLVLVVAIAIAFNLGRGKTPLGTEPDDDNEPTATTSASTSAPAAPPTPFTGITASVLDPQGDGLEHDEDVGNVLDGDPATTWETVTYRQQFGPDGLKTGVGLVLDLGESRSVREIDLSTAGPSTTGVSLYVTEQRPEAVDDLTSVADLQAGREVKTPLADPVTGRYVTIWLTLLPRAPGGFRGEIVDVVVAG